MGGRFNVPSMVPAVQAEANDVDRVAEVVVVLPDGGFDRVEEEKVPKIINSPLRGSGVPGPPHVIPLMPKP
jgi:hypothetical protein